MSTDARFEELIQETVSDIEDVEKLVIQGANEHANFLIDINQALKVSTESLRHLVDNIEAGFNGYSAEVACELVVNIWPIFSAMGRLKEKLKKAGILAVVAKQEKDFDKEMGELYEMINDLIRSKVNVGNDYGVLFKD